MRPVPTAGPGQGRTTHACGACGVRLLSARFWDSGTLVHVERAPDGGGNLFLVPELPGLSVGLPHVALMLTHQATFREHDCPNVRRRAFSADAPARKERP